MLQIEDVLWSPGHSSINKLLSEHCFPTWFTITTS